MRKGPIFSNFILADEINRAPAKVQSAIGSHARKQDHWQREFRLRRTIFIACHTKPDRVKEGTYPLPEAQLDRFMLKVLIDYPSKG